MKKDYIIPTIFLINYEEESKLLSGSFRADCVHAAPDVHQDAMEGNKKLRIVDDENLSEDDYAKKNDWFFDDNAFSDFR